MSQIKQQVAVCVCPLLSDLNWGWFHINESIAGQTVGTRGLVCPAAPPHPEINRGASRPVSSLRSASLPRHHSERQTFVFPPASPSLTAVPRATNTLPPWSISLNVSTIQLPAMQDIKCCITILTKWKHIAQRCNMSRFEEKINCTKIWIHLLDKDLFTSALTHFCS